MGRRRKKDKHLPANIYHRHGAYYFRHYTGKWIHLGRSLGEMFRRYADFVEDGRAIKLVNDLCDRYQREILSGYSEKEQKNRIVHLVRIRAAFGKMAVQDIETRHIRAFRDKLGQRFGREWRRPQLARKSLSVLSHVLSVAVDWDILAANPCRDVPRPPEPQRKRYVTDDEFWAVHGQCSMIHQVAMELAWLTGLRRDDILGLTRDNLTPEGLLVNTGKTDKPLLFQLTAELDSVLRRALAAPPQVRRYIVCTRQGKRYTPDGFSTNWRRARERALKNGELAESYRFNDLRAKSASDDESTEQASLRLGHTSRQTTERFYIRTPRKVRPLR